MWKHGAIMAVGKSEKSLDHAESPVTAASPWNFRVWARQ